MGVAGQGMVVAAERGGVEDARNGAEAEQGLGIGTWWRGKGPAEVRWRATDYGCRGGMSTTSELVAGKCRVCGYFPGMQL